MAITIGREEMYRRHARGILALTVAVVVGWLEVGRAGELSAPLKAQLAASKFVYIASQRKDGTLGQAAEIWFLYHDGAVWVGTPPTSWRVKTDQSRSANRQDRRRYTGRTELRSRWGAGHRPEGGRPDVRDIRQEVP